MITVTKVTRGGNPDFPLDTKVTFDDGTSVMYDCSADKLPKEGQTFEDFIKAVEYIDRSRA